MTRFQGLSALVARRTADHAQALTGIAVIRPGTHGQETGMATMEELLGGHPFFTGLGTGAIQLIAGCAANVHFAAGDHLFGEGEPASRFYVIRHGRVALEVHSHTHGALIIDTMEEGEVLGWSWLVPPYRYFGDARAVTPVSAIALDGTCLRGKCEADSGLGYELLKRVTTVMYHRLESARVRLLDMYGPRVVPGVVPSGFPPGPAARR